MMHQAQRAQGLDQLQFAVVEFTEHLVARQHMAELPSHVFRITGQQHPQVLDCRPHARIVEIDKVRAVLRPQHVAGMAVAVQAKCLDAAGAPETLTHPLQRLIGMVNERDLLTVIDIDGDRVLENLKRRVSDVMTTPVVAAAPVTDIRRIAAAMLEGGLSAVPILNESERIVGIVSRTDVLRAVMTDPPVSLWR